MVCVPKTLSELMTKAIGACSDFMRDLGLQVVLATGRSHVLAQGYRGHQGVRPARVAAARRTRRAHGGTGAQPRRGFHLKGPVVVEGRTGVLVDGSATPFASVHPEMMPLLKRVLSRISCSRSRITQASTDKGARLRPTDSSCISAVFFGFPFPGVLVGNLMRLALDPESGDAAL